jgi:kynureninase
LSEKTLNLIPPTCIIGGIFFCTRMEYQTSLAFAQAMDQADTLARFRQEFLFPQHGGNPCHYFTGNSLGLQPKRARQYLESEMHAWEARGVEGHFTGEKPWMHYHKYSKKALANLTGAQAHEVVSMGNLTANLHLLLASFYKPTSKRYKIVAEGGAFPSDQYALETQIKWHGYSPVDSLVEVFPRAGEDFLRTEDILHVIHEQGEQLALVMFSGVQYYTGQWFDIEAITRAAHEEGAYAGFDLAHAIGNVPLELHSHGVDFAVWCSYKYLNSGPGGVSGIFVHERHGNKPDMPRLGGWWGHSEEERFLMKKGFIPMPGADGWQLSNVNVLSTAVHLASLSLFEEAGMTTLRTKSVALTGFLEFLIQDIQLRHPGILRMLTPTSPIERGCQISLYFEKYGKAVFEDLWENGITTDWREPNVIRVAPVPLYNSYEDVWALYEGISKALSYHTPS